MIPILAHAGLAPAPHDVWAAWNLDPVLLVGAALLAVLYHRGSGARSRPAGAHSWGRKAMSAGALVVLAVALVSPLDAMAGALASAHMVQHVLLLLVAAPLLALGAPFAVLLAGSPPAVRRASLRWRRRLGVTHAKLRLLREPATLWLFHTGTIWFWHAAGPYEAALEHHGVHVVEHASFLVTAVLFWHAVIGARARRAAEGIGILLVFAMALQGVFLSLLLTFAPSPWYSSYEATTSPWGLTPLADQQLAGVIMWIPAGLVYLGAGIALLVAWLQAAERAGETGPTAPALSGRS